MKGICVLPTQLELIMGGALTLPIAQINVSFQYLAHILLSLLRFQG